jgi:hypothetical protein
MKNFINDIKHISWLIKQMIVLFLKGDIDGAVEAWFWIKIHWNYESKKIK